MLVASLPLVAAWLLQPPRIDNIRIEHIQAAKYVVRARGTPLQMSLSPQVEALDFGAADAASLPEVASFFVDSFWLASTTFGDGIKLTGGERGQLVRKVTEDLGFRYGLCQQKRPETLRGNTKQSQPLFWTRLILAREPDGTLVGCAGIEASLFDTITGAVLRSDQADRLVRAELNAMNEEESGGAADAYREGGIGALAKFVLQEQEQLVEPWLKTYKPYALLANLAVSPSFRRTGLGRELCEFCESGCEVWGMSDILLQVEEANGAARKLYESLGYSQIYRVDDATSLRLSPSEKGFINSFLPIENESLLREEPSTIVTMAKRVEG